MRNGRMKHDGPSFLSAASLDHVALVEVVGLVPPLRPPRVVVDVAHHHRLVAERGVKPVPVPVALREQGKRGEIYA